MKKIKAYTLLEMIVVISIIMLLTSIAIVTYNSAQLKAAITVHNANVKSLENAALLYLEDNITLTKPVEFTRESKEYMKFINKFPVIPKKLLNHEDINGEKKYIVKIDKDKKIKIIPDAIKDKHDIIKE